MSEYFPKPKCFEGRVKGELDLLNSKADLKDATGVDTSKLIEKDVDKSVLAPADLSKLSVNVAKKCC